jgi:hypothetical protein
MNPDSENLAIAEFKSEGAAAFSLLNEEQNDESASAAGLVSEHESVPPHRLP